MGEVVAASELKLAREARDAVDDDPVRPVARRGRPLRREVWRHAIDVLDDDRVAAVDDADCLEAHGSYGLCLDGAGCDFEGSVRDALVVCLSYPVELHAELVGDHLHGWS